MSLVTIIVPLVALLISVMTFVATQMAMQRSANKDHVSSMEDRLRRCEADKLTFAAQIQEAQDRITYLERRLTAPTRTRRED